MFELKKKKQITPEDKAALETQTKAKTAQQWIPIADIQNAIVYRKDNVLVGMIRVQPLNLDLLSDREKRRKIISLGEKLNGEQEDIQIFCIGRPVDLNDYLDWLQDISKSEPDFTRKKVLRGFIQQASYMASSGETMERRFYIIITKKNTGNKTEQDLMGRLNDLQRKFTDADLISNICNEDECLDVYNLFANPVQAAFEKVEIGSDLPPVLIQ